MTKANIRFKELHESAIKYLENELKYASKTIGYYDRAWRRIWAYMVVHNIDSYSSEVERRFVKDSVKSKSHKNFTDKEKFFYNGSKMLTEFLETGKMSIPTSPCKTPYEYRGVIGDLIIEFINHSKNELRRSYSTIRTYKRTLFHFSEFCFVRNIKSIDEIDVGFLLQYINQVDTSARSFIMIVISNLRVFLKYLYDTGRFKFDVSRKIPRYRRVGQPKIPSTYSKKEIIRLIDSIDRSTPTGKRNYAIILLAAKYGLRASDISRLKFESIDWDLNVIKIDQVKTGRELILPLTADVGNAIIEYLKYGRPESDERHIFLLARPPYSRFQTSNVVTHVVQRAFIRAKIEINGRNFGPHSLRHSLGSALLKENTALPVISEILGHQSTETTKFYLRIDLESMKQCMLDVPAISEEFYLQNKGQFYE